MVEGSAIVLVEQERGIGTGVNRHGKRLIDMFSDKLFHRTERQDGSCAYIKRHGFKINRPADFAASFDPFTRPIIVPSRARKVDLSFGRSLFDHWSHQHVPAPQILVSTLDRLRIVGKVQPQSAHDRNAGSGAFPHRTVEVGQEAVKQFQVFPADRLYPRVVQLARIGNNSASVIVDLYGTGIAAVPTPGKPQFPGAAMTTEERTKCPE